MLLRGKITRMCYKWF